MVQSAAGSATTEAEIHHDIRPRLAKDTVQRRVELLEIGKRQPPALRVQRPHDGDAPAKLREVSGDPIRGLLRVLASGWIGLQREDVTQPNEMAWRGSRPVEIDHDPDAVGPCPIQAVG